MAAPKNNGKRWTPSEVSILRKDAKTLKAPKIADKLKRTEEAIQQKAHKEGIKLKKAIVHNKR